MSLINVEKETREKVQNVINRYQLKQVDIAKETGINHSSLSLWLQGKIKGHTTKIEQGMKEWLQNFTQNMPHFREQKEQETQKLIEYEPNTDCLIPVSLDAEVDGLRYKEFFCWNATESHLTPESFAKIICEENQFPPTIEIEIIQAIKRAVQSYKPYAYSTVNEEMLRIIEISIRIDNIQFKDQFEWDINDPNNSPEAFSWALSEELGLPSEFAQRIAHQVREQVQFYQKQVIEKKNAGLQEDKSYKKQTRSIYQINPGPFSTATDPDFLVQWEPTIEILDENEIRKVQKQEERKYRYQKRVR